MEAAAPLFERGSLVEVEGLAEEGFPASFVQGIVLQPVKGGLIVEYLEFLDEVTGKQLIEYQPLSRFRPFLPAAARFASWEDIQVGWGMCATAAVCQAWQVPHFTWHVPCMHT